jgi:hypothetical protein
VFAAIANKPDGEGKERPLLERSILFGGFIMPQSVRMIAMPFHNAVFEHCLRKTPADW